MTFISAVVLVMAIYDYFYNNSNKPADSEADSNTSSQIEKLTFELTSTESIQTDKQFIVEVTGKTIEGKEVSDKYDAKLNERYHLDYEEGLYKFNVDVSSLNNNDKIYHVCAVEIAYDGLKDNYVKLTITLDEEAMAKKKAEADSTLNTQQQAQQQQTQKIEESSHTWFLVKTTGTFHISESCSAYKRSKVANRTTIQGTRSGLEAQGYHACLKCM